ncbi:MAG TPA: spore protease YyaC [Bacillota bacterium]
MTDASRRPWSKGVAGPDAAAPGSQATWTAASLRIGAEALDASQRLERAFASMVLEWFPERRHHLFFLCIGTDRSTGDALGPLVGTFLARHGVPAERILGTLDEPVHAANLQDALRSHGLLNPQHRLVVAIDACLGPPENVGTLNLGVGSLRPGAGVHKQLPAVGDLYLTGTVNTGGFMEFFVLQNTRLSLVMRMATVAAEALARATARLLGASAVAAPLTPC